MLRYCASFAGLAICLCIPASASASADAPATDAKDEAQVAAPPPAAPSPEAQPPATTRTGLGGSLTAGTGFLLNPEGRAQSRLGLGLAARGEIPVFDRFGLGLVMSMGATDWERSMAAIAVGLVLASWTVRGFGAVARWTGGAYGSVWRWMTSGPKEWALFKLLGGMFGLLGVTMAFLAGEGFLVASLVTSGLLVVLSPLAATSFVQTGVSAAIHLTRGGKGPDVFGEVGIGGLLFVDPEQSRVGPGWGPFMGVGLRTGGFTAAIHLTWSPPTYNDTQSRSILAGGLTFGVVR